MHSLGPLLRAHRERAGLTQEQVEEATGITQGHVSAIEVGRREPSLDVLRRLARLYNLTAEQQGELLAAEGGSGAVA